MQNKSCSFLCPCGSGRKYKKCCQLLTGSEKHIRDEEKRQLVRRAEGTTLEILIRYALKNGGDSFFDLADSTYCFIFKEIVFPPEMEVEATDPFLYCFHIYASFLFPFHISGDCKSRSAARYLLEERPSLFRRDQLQFLQSVVFNRFRWLVVADIQDHAYVTVTDIESGETFTLRDLGLSSSGSKGMLLMAIVFSMWGDHYLLGAFPRCLPGDWAGTLVAKKDEAIKSTQADLRIPEIIQEHEIFKSDFLQRTIFYSAIEEHDSVQHAPRITNTDGDIMEHRIIEYSLDVEPIAAQQMLLKGSRQFKPTENPDSIELIWYGYRPKRDATGESYLRGIVRLVAGKILVEVNSENRAAKLCKLIEKTLGNRIEFLSETAPSMDDLVSETAPEVLSPEIRAKMQAKIDSYYENWVDEKIPALNNLTPRQAAQDQKMKQVLEALLLEFSRKKNAAKSDSITPDIELIRARIYKNFD